MPRSKIGKRAKRAQPRKMRKGPSKGLVKAIKSVIHEQAETKQTYTQQSSTNFNSGINSSADCLQLIGNVSQGTGDNARIGDQIRAQSLKVKGFFISRFTGGAGTTYYQNCRIGVRIMIVQPKAYIGLGAIQANATTWQSTLLKRGGTTTGFTGIIPDLYSDINTDAVTCYYNKVFYVQNPYSNAVFGSAGNTLLMPEGTTRFFSKTLKLRNKCLKYDNSIDSGLTSTNFNPVMLLGHCYLDGTSPDSVTTNIAMSFDAYTYFEDS